MTAATVPPGSLTVDNPLVGIVSLTGTELGLGFAGARAFAAVQVVEPDGLRSLAYDWRIDGVSVDITLDSSLALTDAMAGHRLTVTLRAVDVNGNVSELDSTNGLSIIAVPHPAAPHPNQAGSLALAGTVAAGQALHATVTDADGTGTVYYLWQQHDSNGAWAAVPGATGATLALPAAGPVRVVVEYADQNGSVEQHAAILGSDGADQLGGTGAQETIRAGAGADHIAWSGGGDLVDGGAGLDTFTLPFDSQFAQVVGSGGTVYVATLTGQSAALTDVERVVLTDGAYAFAGAAATLVRLYEGAFGRAPDPVGMGYWLGRMDAGLSSEDVAASFAASSEFAGRYGSTLDHAALVDALYHNALGRAPDAGGSAYWNALLDQHPESVAAVLLSFTDSAETVARMSGTLEHGTFYQPWGQ